MTTDAARLAVALEGRYRVERELGAGGRQRCISRATSGTTTGLTMLAVVAVASAAILGCRAGRSPMDMAALQEFGANYTAAWCSQNAASVAAFFADDGSLTINEGTPSVGRAAITAAAQGFMTAFPDMVVAMDGIGVEGGHVVYRWTLTGTNTGPGGTGKAVRISGHEEWTMSADGLIAKSKGHFDQAEYNRQLQVGVEGR